ncbi:unnamed protein product [marine sediment metagenome]|uniref:Extracellular solute-binding protein n=1 Tax=marine sediment metagenome TaxID=412755 RepID=X1E8T0_9ZZZZ
MIIFLAGKVSLMMWGGAIEEKQMKEYLAAFNEEYPDVKVEIIRPADYWPKLMSMMAAGTPPDVFYMGFPEFVSYHEKGAILSLQSYINADPNFNEPDFFPGLLGAFKDRDTKEIFGIPKDWSTYVVYYNKECSRREKWQSNMSELIPPIRTIYICYFIVNPGNTL